MAAKKELSACAKVALFPVALVQFAFAFLAFWDLWHRRADDVNGPKPLWIPAILINWIGPAAYFIFGVKR
jgi:Phospholipase_D-nuclease N-terminal